MLVKGAPDDLMAVKSLGISIADVEMIVTYVSIVKNRLWTNDTTIFILTKYATWRHMHLNKVDHH